MFVQWSESRDNISDVRLSDVPGIKHSLVGGIISGKYLLYNLYSARLEDFWGSNYFCLRLFHYTNSLFLWDIRSNNFF